MAKFENLPDQINQLSDAWEKRSGKAVEDFLTRQLESAQNKAIVGGNYVDGQLTLEKADGSTLNPIAITVETPVEIYDLVLYGIMLDNDSSKIYTGESLHMLFNSNRNVKLGLGIKAVLQTSVSESTMKTPLNTRITFNGNYKTVPIYPINHKYFELDNITNKNVLVFGDENPADVLSWIDITDLFEKSATSAKITAQVINKTDKIELNTSITNEVIYLSYSGKIVLNTNALRLQLNGNSSNKFHLIGYNGSEPITPTDSGDYTYTELVPGLNQLSLRAVHDENQSTIFTDWFYIDVIYTEGLTSTDPIAAVNGINNGIANNDVATLYELTIYSPNDDELELATYLEDEWPDEYNLTLQNRIKYEITSPSQYDVNTHTYVSTYQKYIELEGTDIKYLVVKIGDTYYRFYSVNDNTNRCSSNIYKEMKVDAIVPEYTYYSDITPSHNFDQIVGYLNNVFITDTYATASNPANIISALEASDGWNESEGRTYFKVSAQDNPIFKTPLNLNLDDKFTIEMGIKTYNVSDKNKPILTLGKLQLRPTQLCWNVDESLENWEETFLSRNSGFEENTETHIMITVQKGWTVKTDNIYYPDFLGDYQTQFENKADSQTLNLVRIFINGVIDREIALDDTELATLKESTLQINPTTSDINFYLFRVYNTTALNFEQVQRNYISFIPHKTVSLTSTAESKEKFYNKNDILNNNGEISWEKCLDKLNTLVYIYPSGGKFPHRFWGGPDGDAPNVNKNLPVTLFINYADQEINKNYGGRLTYGQVKGQGSSAMRYLIWNVTFALNKFKDENDKKIKSIFTPYSQLEDDRFKEAPITKEGYYNMPNKYTISTSTKGQQDTNPYKYTKMVGKVNFASSMQSHKIGACKLYDDAYKSNLYALKSGGKKAVHEEPFMYFYWETDKTIEEVAKLEYSDLIANNQNIKFMGFQTWGPGKGDDACSGYDEDLTPEYLMLEGGENGDRSVQFTRPWQALQRSTYVNGSGKINVEQHLSTTPTVDYEESLQKPWKNLLIDDESIVYTNTGAWDIDYGCEEIEEDKETGTSSYFQFVDSIRKENDLEAQTSLKVFREFYDFVYTHDFTFERSSDITPQESWNKAKKYLVVSNTFSIKAIDESGSEYNTISHARGNVYRYDENLERWVNAGTEYNSATGWSVLNYFTLTGETNPEDVKIILKNKFKEGIVKYIDLSDIAFHQALVKFLSGTDNRAKNTYFQIIGPIYEEVDGELVLTNKGDYKIRLIGDDLDTILVTDNNGLQSKPYNLIESSYDETMVNHWGDSGNNIFFTMFDRCFEAEVKAQLQGLINVTELNPGNVGNRGNYFYDAFFGVQEFFPAVAYNHTAKIYYENAQVILDSKVFDEYANNKIEPIQQSHGSCLACERQFMKERLNFLSGYAKAGLGAVHATTDATGAGGKEMRLKMQFEPYQDFYPLYNNGDQPSTSHYLYEDTKAEYLTTKNLVKTGNTYDVSIKRDSQIHQGLFQMDLYKSLNITGLLEQNFDPDLSRTVSFTIDNANIDSNSDLFGTEWPDTAFTGMNANMPVVETLTLNNIQLPDTLDLSKYFKLKTLDLTNAITEYVIFPQSGRLNTVILPGSIKTFRVYNNPGLTNVTFKGLSNLETIYIDCNKCGAFDVANFCESLKDCQTLKSVTLKNVNMSLTEETLLKLISVEHHNIQGIITVIDENGSEKAISFDTKQQLVNYYGNINTGSKGLTIKYRSSTIVEGNITCNNEISVFKSGSEEYPIYRENMLGLTINSGNDVNIVNDRLDITYALNSSVATIDQTGKITMTGESAQSGTVTITIKTSTATIIKTVIVHFQWKAPALGDFAYADGSFTSSYDASKTLVGLVYAKKETDAESGTVYIIGKEYAGEEQYIGYSNDGNSGGTNILKDLYNVYAYMYGSTLNSSGLGLGAVADNYGEVGTTKIPSTLLNTSISTSTYTDFTTDYFYGKNDLIKYLKKVSIILEAFRNRFTTLSSHIVRKTVQIDGVDESIYVIASKESFDYLCKYLPTIANTNITDESDIMNCLLYPYFYNVYFYQPEAQELDPQYAQGNWYVPSIGEMSRVIYYRGYSVRGSNFVSGQESSVSETISRTISNGNTPETTPIFSLAAKSMSIIPEVWNTLVPAVSDANDSLQNRIAVSTEYSSTQENYSYQVFTYYNYSTGSGSTTDKYVWRYGYPNNDYSWAEDTHYVGEKIWRLRKQQCIPFTQYNYSKPQ